MIPVTSSHFGHFVHLREHTFDRDDAPRGENEKPPGRAIPVRRAETVAQPFDCARPVLNRLIVGLVVLKAAGCLARGVRMVVRISDANRAQVIWRDVAAEIDRALYGDGTCEHTP